MTTRFFSLLTLLAATTAALPAHAQLDLPRLSPSAKVTQTVGLTDITVDYSSPSVRGRKIWGGLVPYGQLWRAGANTATKISFNKEITIGTTVVPPGTYALFAMPTKTSWTIILNKDFNQSGVADYKKELDLVRLEVKPEPIPNRERLTFLFSDFSNAATNLDLEWEKLRVTIPIKLSTDAQVAANLKGLVENAWVPYNSAARYLLEQKKDYDKGIEFVDKSLAIKEDWQNLWTKAQLLAAKGNYKQALPLAEQAQKLGATSARFFFAEEVKKALVEWKNK